MGSVVTLDSESLSLDHPPRIFLNKHQLLAVPTALIQFCVEGVGLGELASCKKWPPNPFLVKQWLKQRLFTSGLVTSSGDASGVARGH